VRPRPSGARRSNSRSKTGDAASRRRSLLEVRTRSPPGGPPSASSPTFVQQSRAPMGAAVWPAWVQRLSLTPLTRHVVSTAHNRERRRTPWQPLVIVRSWVRVPPPAHFPWSGLTAVSPCSRFHFRLIVELDQAQSSARRPRCGPATSESWTVGAPAPPSVRRQGSSCAALTSCSTRWSAVMSSCSSETEPENHRPVESSAGVHRALRRWPVARCEVRGTDVSGWAPTVDPPSWRADLLTAHRGGSAVDGGGYTTRARSVLLELGRIGLPVLMIPGRSGRGRAARRGRADHRCHTGRPLRRRSRRRACLQYREAGGGQSGDHRFPQLRGGDSRHRRS
jgi:hypothetical protein